MDDEILGLIHHARKLIWRNGYRPIPILSPDTGEKGAGKRPAGTGPNWSKWEIDARQDPPHGVQSKPTAHAANTGVLADGLCPLDIDVDDPDLASAIDRLAVEMLGDAPTRYREDSPRRLKLYRAAEGEPRHIEVLEDEAVAAAAGRKPYGVEVLGKGNQFVAIGHHPDGAFLDWTDRGSPITVARSDLPAVTEAQITEFLSVAGELLGSKKPRRNRQNCQNPAPGRQAADSERASAGFGGSVMDDGDTALADVEAALAVIPGDGGSYKVWIRVGMAIHAATGGSQDGRAAYDEWSKKSSKYDADEVDRVWRTFRPSSLSFGTLVHMTQEIEPAWRAPSWSTNGVDPSHEDEVPSARITIDILNRNTIAAPPFPVCAFGPGWGTWIERAADVANASVGHIAPPLLSVASALIGNARWAQNWDGWKEPPILWCATVGEPSSSKSPGAKTVVDLLAQVEAHLGADFEDVYATWEERAARATAEKKNWEKALTAAIAAGDEVAAMPRSVVPPEPMRPVAKVGSVTVEKMVDMLARQPKGFLMSRDELADWLGNMFRYSNGGTDRPFWLEVWSGQSYRVDRKTSGTALVQCLSCAVFGTIQPDRLNALFKDADDGLSSRFLWAWPESRIFSKPRGTLDVTKAIAALCRLADLTMLVDDSGSVRPVVVSATDEAADLLADFARDMQRREPLAAGNMKGTLGKARGHALRLSLVLEFLWWSMTDRAEPRQISTKAMRAAISLMYDFFLPMASRVLGDAAITQQERDARTLAKWIAAERPDRINLRELSRGATGCTPMHGLRDRKRLDAAAEWLQDCGWFLPPAQQKLNGRPRSDFVIAPNLWSAIDAHT